MELAGAVIILEMAAKEASLGSQPCIAYAFLINPVSEVVGYSSMNGEIISASSFTAASYFAY